MAKYIKQFVTGHGIVFERSKRNIESFEKATILWREISKKVEPTGKSIVMLCGAKNNGKSSLTRYLVNNYLASNKKRTKTNKSQESIEMMDDDHDDELLENNKSNERDDDYAYFIDYDPGQCEMTSPGMISAHIIRASDQPLQSPTYLNVSQHESLVMSSVGGTNMSVNPRMYIENSRYVFNRVKEHRDAQPIKKPIFINTMGHIRNVGLAMLTDLIKICRPTNLIVLNIETDPMRTIYADLSPQAIDSARASFYYETNKSSQKKLNYQYDTYNLPFTFIDSTSIASKNRTALQLAYMATIPEALYKPVMQLGTKWISFRKVAIHCVSSYPLKEGIVLDLLLHSWVHFVKLKRSSVVVSNKNEQDDQNSQKSTDHEINNTGIHMPSVICKLLDGVNENHLFGCGIVSDIDSENRKLSVITPLTQDILDSEVDCIIKPLSIQVPAEILHNDLYN